MKKLYTLTAVLLLLMSCGNEESYWPTSKFRIVKDALVNDEEVKIIYASAAHGINHESNFYIQMIAVSERTSDTVNILTNIYNGFSDGDVDQVFVFQDKDQYVYKIGEMDLEDLQNLKNTDKIQNANPKARNKVYRDPRFDYIADNNFPTVVGIIGLKNEKGEIRQNELIEKLKQ